MAKTTDNIVAPSVELLEAAVNLHLLEAYNEGCELIHDATFIGFVSGQWLAILPYRSKLLARKEVFSHSFNHREYRLKGLFDEKGLARVVCVGEGLVYYFGTKK